MEFTIALTTKTYYIGHNFYIDITENHISEYYEAWIWNNRYGIKDLMFGGPINQHTYKEFKEIVENNIKEYMNYYVDDHFDYDEREKYYENNNSKIK